MAQGSDSLSSSSDALDVQSGIPPPSPNYKTKENADSTHAPIHRVNLVAARPLRFLFSYNYYTLSNFRCLSCPNAMHGQFGKFSPRKASSHRTVLPSLFVCVCSVFMFPLHRLSGLLFTTDGYGIFNVRTKMGACHPLPEAGSGTNKSAQSLTRRNGKTVACPSPYPPTRGSNLGNSD